MSTEDSSDDKVLRGAMRGALQSGMKQSQLIAIVANGNTILLSTATHINLIPVTGSDIINIAKGAMQCALDRGTKPDVLINIAVEVAFKNCSPRSTKRFPSKQPSLGGKEIENVKKPAISASGAIKFAAGKQTLTPKRAASTEKAPQKKAKTTHTPAVDSDDEHMVTLSESNE
ncbi:hypothetical protein V492_02899 [Pseudogymnoascus sp. VKM F-4246]|nr:hypothetical protein V492_02899 [Pseudogymnoascus sp. VKM F-4246]